jgi:hypothetical protein
VEDMTRRGRTFFALGSGLLYAMFIALGAIALFDVITRGTAGIPPLIAALLMIMATSYLISVTIHLNQDGLYARSLLRRQFVAWHDLGMIRTNWHQSYVVIEVRGGANIRFLRPAQGLVRSMDELRSKENMAPDV